MRVAWGVVVVGLSACNAVLGIGDLRVSGGDDGGDMSPADVTGTAIDTWFTSATTTKPFPQDLSTVTLQAYVPDDSAAGFRIIESTSKADGKFTIPGVPQSGYYLLVKAADDPVSHFYWTTSRTPDLGIKRLGRPDGPRTTQATPVTLHVSGVVTPAAINFMRVDSFATAGESGFTIPPDTAVFDKVVYWNDLAVPLPSADLGDDLHVFQEGLSRDATMRVTRQFIVGASSTALSLVDGQPATVNAALRAPTAQASLFHSVDVSSYQGGFEVSSHLPFEPRFNVRANFYAGAHQGPNLLGVRSDYNGAFAGMSTFADPFPAGWPRSVLFFPTITWSYASRKQRTAQQVESEAIERVPFSSSVVFRAPFSPPRAIKVGGVTTTQPAAIPFDGVHAVTVEWAAIVGVGHFSVRVVHLVERDGPRDIATFDTDAQSVTMPASLFAVGESYVVTVTGIVDPTTDYASGQLRLIGFPNAEREAPTARLLFAASCGNGVVDAPYEECDSSGVATADCNPDCTKPVCGDAYANPVAGEVCDDAGLSLVCNTDCTPSMCGDGKINYIGGEACDLGARNGQSGACCDTSCNLVPPATFCQ